ncbi:hypothetical protein AB0I30_23195 [Nocardia tengchongensis]|uniref:hypothetical protein n=1 Tax=Nocardia tengchongensis TaxID=2055889 RepID=UPI0033C80CBB
MKVDLSVFLPEDEHEIFLGHEHRLQTYMDDWDQGKVPTPVPQADSRPFLAVAASAAARCEKLLAILAPETAVAAWRHADPYVVRALSDLTVLDRVLWTVAVGARGGSHDLLVLTQFLQEAGRWWAAQWVADSYLRIEDTTTPAAAAASVPGREFLSRTTAQAIRYHWASAMICTQIAIVIEDDPQFRAALPEFTLANTERCIQIADRHGHRSGLVTTPWNDPATDLARLLCLDAGALTARPFPQLMTSHEIDLHPWVAFEHGFAPAAAGTARLGMERCLLAAVDARLLRLRNTAAGRKLDKGELYERVAQRCLEQVFADGSPTQPPRPLTIALPGQGSPDIDCSLIDDAVRVIGEAKAMESPAAIGSAAAAFETQLTKIVNQLQGRLDALDAGTPIIDGAGHPHASANRKPVVGLGIVLHLYSGSLPDARMLELLPRAVISNRIAVADLHAWMIVLSSLSTIGELRHYLRYRAKLLTLGVSVVDECDFAVAYHSPRRDKIIADFRKTRARFPGRNAVLQLTPMCVHAQDSFNRRRPTDPRRWREQFFDDVQPLPVI